MFRFTGLILATLLALPGLASAASMTVNAGTLTSGGVVETLGGNVDLTGSLMTLSLQGNATGIGGGVNVSWLDAGTFTVASGQYATLNGSEQVRISGLCTNGTELTCDFTLVNTAGYRGNINGLTASVLNGAAAIPEPVSTALLGAGALIVGAFVRRRETTC